jgi:uncharacterized protein YndB with AHSA1/START domain
VVAHRGRAARPGFNKYASRPCLAVWVTSLILTCYSCRMSTQRIRRRIDAPRSMIYRALLDARAVAAWRAPDGMSCHVHEFDPREGGRFRASLSYDVPTGAGKTSPDTDTYHGRFAKLMPDEQVVEVVEFETADPALQGEMTISTTLRDADGGTEIVVAFEGLPPGVPEAANETGTRMSLAKLAALVEGQRRST